MIETKHNDHIIRYKEDSSVWWCEKMRLQHESLAKLRTMLNEEDREERRVGNIRAYHISNYGDSEVILTLIEPHRSGANGFQVGSNSKRREYFAFSSLVLVNDANVPKIERYKNARAARDAARDAAQEELDAAREALPHPTAEQLAKLTTETKRKKVA